MKGYYLLGILLVLAQPFGYATPPPVAARVDYEDMLDNYAAYQAIRQNQPQALPFDLYSSEKRIGGVSGASVRYVLPKVSFDVFTHHLSQAAEWCEFIPLHLNIKACVALRRGDKEFLRFYTGVKNYLTPQQAALLELIFTLEQRRPMFILSLNAAQGPYGSADIQFQFRAIEVAEGIYLEFDLSSVPGLAAQLARVYLTTVARNKVGFSVVGKTWSGAPKYIRGQRGATERNIVRYLLSIESYFATLALPPEQRFAARIEHWFDATESFSLQLREMSRATYLSTKQRERQNQAILKAALAAGLTPVYTQTKTGSVK